MKLKCKKLKIEELAETLDILRQDNLRYADGTYPEEVWISSFINKGYAFGAYENNSLKAVLMAENMLSGGVYLWLLATKKENIGKGYGQFLYTEFEKKMRKKNKNWIYLTSWEPAQSFYERNGFLTAGVTMKEYCKDI